MDGVEQLPEKLYIAARYASFESVTRLPKTFRSSIQEIRLEGILSTDSCELIDAGDIDMPYLTQVSPKTRFLVHSLRLPALRKLEQDVCLQMQGTLDLSALRYVPDNVTLEASDINLNSLESVGDNVTILSEETLQLPKFRHAGKNFKTNHPCGFIR